PLLALPATPNLTTLPISSTALYFLPISQPETYGQTLLKSTTSWNSGNRSSCNPREQMQERKDTQRQKIHYFILGGNVFTNVLSHYFSASILLVQHISLHLPRSVLLLSSSSVL